MITVATPKSKMVAAAITLNYKIGHNLKSIQVRNPIFARPMFLRVRNAMNLSFAFYDHSNYPKMAAFWVKIGVLRLNTCLGGAIL